MRYNSAISTKKRAEVIASDLRGAASSKYVFIPFAANIITGEKPASNRRIGGFPDSDGHRPVQI
jgi:hypothetical protein